ncbi:MAG: hypothetical protein ACREFE_11985 [Limisphaerales bacterium]
MFANVSNANRHELRVSPEDFDIIPANQDLYLCDHSRGALLKLSHTYLQDYVGDLLITQAGEFEPARLFIVNWNGTQFVVRSIPAPGGTTDIEHVTFAPLDLPSQPIQY